MFKQSFPFKGKCQISPSCKRQIFCHWSFQIVRLRLKSYLAKKAFIIWKCLNDFSSYPWLTWSRVINQKNNITRNEIAGWSWPFLPFLQLRQELFCPSLPKQIWYTVYCACLHRRRAYTSALWKIPGGNDGVVFKSNKWLGVSASKSLGSVDSFVMGQPLVSASTSQRTVWRLSSSRCCVLKVEFSSFLTDLINISHEPPWCEPVGGLKIHLIPFCKRVLLMFLFVFIVK